MAEKQEDTGKKPVFDIGDTLTPSYSKINEEVRRKVSEAGYSEIPEFPINRYNIYVEKEVKKWLERHGFNRVDPEKISKSFKEWEEKFFAEEVVPVLKKINRDFGPIGFISDNSLAAKKFYMEIFDREGLSYQGFVVSEEVGVEKPDPEIFREFIERREEEAESFAYFGNYVDRDRAAEKTGIDFVWVKQFHTFGSSTDRPQIEEVSYRKVREALRELEKR